MHEVSVRLVVIPLAQSAPPLPLPAPAPPGLMFPEKLHWSNTGLAGTEELTYTPPPSRMARFPKNVHRRICGLELLEYKPPPRWLGMDALAFPAVMVKPSSVAVSFTLLAVTTWKLFSP